MDSTCNVCRANNAAASAERDSACVIRLNTSGQIVLTSDVLGSVKMRISVGTKLLY